jgi:hypothetical protein
VDNKTKIEEYKNLKSRMSSNINMVKLCCGYSYSKKNERYEYDSSIDKRSFKFTTQKYDYMKPIYLYAYHGYYGDSSTYSFGDDFYIQCMAEAINKNMSIIIKDTEEIMKNKCNKALTEAKEEATVILKEAEELGLCE